MMRVWMRDGGKLNIGSIAVNSCTHGDTSGRRSYFKPTKWLSSLVHCLLNSSLVMSSLGIPASVVQVSIGD